MQASQPCFFLVVSLFHFLNQYQGIAAQEAVDLGLDPRKWLSTTGSSGAERGSMTLEDLKPSQNDVTALNSDHIRLGSQREPKTKTISNRLLGNVTQNRTLFYKTGSGQNSRSYPNRIKTRGSLLRNRQRRLSNGLFASSFEIPSLTKGTQGEGIQIGDQIGVPGLNLTITISKFDECVHICLAHALCAGASFHVRTLICRLMDKMDDTKRDKQLRHVGIEIQYSGSNDSKIFRVNPTVLTHVLGKCADRPCTNGTFCSQSTEAGYICLPLEKFLRQIQKRNAEPGSDNNVRRAELVRTKRSLSEEKDKQPLKKGKSKTHVDCGLPPKLEKALSLYVNTYSGASATYYCEHGSVTSAKNTNIQCQTNGKWTKPDFVCVAHKHCGIPRKIPNTMMNFYMVNGINMITYKCKNNSSIKTSVKCNPHNGTWGIARLKCNSRPQGKPGLLRENPSSKTRGIPKRKNRPPTIAHAKDKSSKPLGAYTTSNSQRKSQTLKNETSLMKYSKTSHVPGSTNGKKTKSHYTGLVSKHSGRLEIPKKSANISKIPVPKERHNASVSESKLNTVKENDPSSFTRNGNNKINTHKEFNSRTPKKANLTNSKPNSSFTAHRNASEPNNVFGIISKLRMLNGIKPSSSERGLHEKPIPGEKFNSTKTIKDYRTNSKPIFSVTANENAAKPKVIEINRFHSVSGTISKSKWLNSSRPSNSARSIHNKSISDKGFFTPKTINDSPKNSKRLHSFKGHKTAIAPEMRPNVSTTISKPNNDKNGSFSSSADMRIKLDSFREFNTSKETEFDPKNSLKQKKSSGVSDVVARNITKNPAVGRKTRNNRNPNGTTPVTKPPKEKDRGSEINNKIKSKKEPKPKFSDKSNPTDISNVPYKSPALGKKNDIKLQATKIIKKQMERDNTSITLATPDTPRKSLNTKKKHIVYNIVKNRTKEIATIPISGGPVNKLRKLNTMNNLFAKDYRLFVNTKVAKELINMGVHGVVRADVNAKIGVPGFTCTDPTDLQYASSFYGSRVVGSKASFRCNHYFFASPVPHCPLVTCLLQGIWSELFLSCSDLDCINPAKLYVGKRTCTSSGFRCKRWDEAIVDPEIIAILTFPERDISQAENYCRDPLRDGMVWCFTDDPTMIWDYCDVPFCN